MALDVHAIYPGTFDPITLGHEDLLRRAAQLFGRVTVAVAMAHHKKTLFSLEERMDMVRQALQDCPQVQVEPFEGLVTEFAAARGAQAMVRGLRSGTDFDYEFQLAGIGERAAERDRLRDRAVGGCGWRHLPCIVGTHAAESRFRVRLGGMGHPSPAR